MTEAGDKMISKRSISAPPWLLAGIVAITVNSALLSLAAKCALNTGNGALLRLIRSWISPMVDRTELAHVWMTIGLPDPASHEFAMGFHFFIGILMAMIYGHVERLVQWNPWVKGLVYAAAVYAANALIVFPLLGDGIAGSRILSGIGLAYFALAHTSFFLILACCHERLLRLHRRS